MKKNMVRTNLYLTRKQHKAISEEAKKRQIGFSERFRQIVEDYLESTTNKEKSFGKNV